MVGHDMQLPDNFQAFKLLDRANLSKDDCKLVLDHVKLILCLAKSMKN